MKNVSKIKICGITTQQELDYIENMSTKPDYIGFVFAKSKRKITVNQLENFTIPPKIQKVGVFVNPTLDKLASTEHLLDVFQLHGSETEDFILSVKSNFPNKTIIKAISVTSISDVKIWENTSAHYILLDNGKGGTGEKFNWNILENNISKPYFLAGGINLDNITTALSYSSYCIDVSSGVETDGKKDNTKMLEIINTVKKG